jgi:hypothetical protein
MTTIPDTTFKDVVKAVAIALEAKGRFQFDRALLYLHKRNVERQAVLAKWLWKQLFHELQRELAKGPGNRDIKKVAELVQTMRRLVPPPPGRNDKKVGFPPAEGLAADFSTAFINARQRAAEAAANEAQQEDEDVETFNREVYDQVLPSDESAGDPTDVGTKEEKDAEGHLADLNQFLSRRTTSQYFTPLDRPPFD